MQIEGHLDSLTPWGASGWAWISSAPEISLEVEALLDGETIGRTTASEFRSDLLELGKGTGLYGFFLSFEGRLRNGALPTIRIVGADAAKFLTSATWNTVDGHVDSLTRRGAVGWAWIPNRPEAAAEVEALLGDRVIGRATASEPRIDLLQSGRGTGNYGFTLVFDHVLTAEISPAIRVRGPQGSVELPGFYKFAPETDWNPPPVGEHGDAQQREEPAAFGLSVEGHVDSLTRSVASGWAWQPARPDDTVEIEAVLDGRVVGRARANQSRPDLAEHGKGHGNYGFLLSFNAPIYGDKSPNLRVLGPEGPTILPGATEFVDSRPTETSSRPSADAGMSGASLPEIEGGVDLITRWDATGWAWMPVAPNAVVQIEAVLDDRVIGRATANEMRPDLLEYGKGTGLYGFKVSFTEPVIGETPPTLRVLAAIGHGLQGSKTLPAPTDADLVPRSRGSLESLFREHAKYTAQSEDFEEFDPHILGDRIQSDAETRPLLIAFYLPQFHAIPENDLFWGQGFTEWRQLPRGLPRFPGHYQPRIPRDFGFYNLTDHKSLEIQANTAKAAGVSAFAYYYYWFDRKRVLEKPLEILLSSSIDMPFMLIWANENWTRTWDGAESQVLLKQTYDEQDELALLSDLARHFSDRRYVRVDGRPLFVIYNPRNVPDASATIQRWRRTLAEQFSVYPLIFMAQTFGERDPSLYGLDGAIEFPPHKLSDKLPGRPTPDAYSHEFTGRVIAYDDFAKASLNEVDTDFPLIKTIVPSWDNDSRRPNRGLTLENSSPAKYEAWLRALIERAMEKPVFGTPIVAINAWNEWAEGAYLEPDIHFGGAYLNATARALNAGSGQKRLRLPAPTDQVGTQKVSVILPNYNHARFLEERIRTVVDQAVRPNEIIFLDDCSSDNSVELAEKLLRASGISYKIVVNEGNSGCVFKQWAKGLSIAQNDLIWIAETDDSAHPEFLRHVVPAFERDDVMASFGQITCIGEHGHPRDDLFGYYDGLKDFSTGNSTLVPAAKAFSYDFAVKNVIPNASGLVFRKPHLTKQEMERLFEYRFAGDWYFYALVVRGGTIAFSRLAKSYFRVRESSASRDSFFGDRHLNEHRMILEDISRLYDVSAEAKQRHIRELSKHFPGNSLQHLGVRLLPSDADSARLPLRICVAAHSFGIGGGEVLPLELANELKARGHHVTYFVKEKIDQGDGKSLRHRLRPDIPVVYAEEVLPEFSEFLSDYGIQVINSHNVSIDYHLYLSHVSVDIPYIASLHGGYETVADILEPGFVGFLNRTVSLWLSLAEKNKKVLVDKGVNRSGFRRSFNAVPLQAEEWKDRAAFRVQHGIAADTFVMVICSRAIQEKGWRTAIEVTKELNGHAGKKFHLVLIGDGAALPDLKAEYGHDPELTFLGHVDRPSRLLRCFDLGIFPSVYAGETFPLFLLECFSAGIPVVTTDIGEIPDIMGSEPDARPGTLVSVTSGTASIREGMVDHVREIVTGAGVYTKMCHNAGRANERFSMKRLGDLYEEVFRNAVAQSVSELSK